ncbi:transposase [Bacillus gaemokensis]|nr:transposase [Bacillus gaemokensis]
MRLLVIVAIHDTPKRRSLLEDFAFVCRGHDRFRFLLSHVKHNEYFATEPTIPSFWSYY